MRNTVRSKFIWKTMWTKAFNCKHIQTWTRNYSNQPVKLAWKIQQNHSRSIRTLAFWNGVIKHKMKRPFHWQVRSYSPLIQSIILSIFTCLTVNCWPSQNGEGGCDVNIEYELEHQQLQLQEVTLTIPLPWVFIFLWYFLYIFLRMMKRINGFLLKLQKWMSTNSRWLRRWLPLWSKKESSHMEYFDCWLIKSSRIDGIQLSIFYTRRFLSGWSVIRIKSSICRFENKTCY